MQCVEIVGDELRVIHDINQRNRYYQLSEFYSRPMTKAEKFISKIDALFEFIFVIAVLVVLIIWRVRT